MGGGGEPTPVSGGGPVPGTAGSCGSCRARFAAACGRMRSGRDLVVRRPRLMPRLPCRRRWLGRARGPGRGARAAAAGDEMVEVAFQRSGDEPLTCSIESFFFFSFFLGTAFWKTGTVRGPANPPCRYTTETYAHTYAIPYEKVHTVWHTVNTNAFVCAYGIQTCIHILVWHTAAIRIDQNKAYRYGVWHTNSVCDCMKQRGSVCSNVWAYERRRCVDTAVAV